MAGCRRTGRTKLQALLVAYPGVDLWVECHLGFALFTLLLSFQGLYRLPCAHRPANWMPGSTYTALSAELGPSNVYLLYGIFAVLLVMSFLWPLYRKKIFLKL